MAIRGFRLLVLNGFLVCLYLVLGHLTFPMSLDLGNVSRIMAVPAGVALAFAILYGARTTLAVLIGQAILAFLSGVSILTGVSIGALSAAGIWLGSHLFERWKLSRGFDRPRDVILFTLLIFGILQPLVASAMVALLYTIDLVPLELRGWFGGLHQAADPSSRLLALDSIPLFWTYWWLTYSIGQLLVTPLLLAWLTPRKLPNPPLHAVKIALMLSATLGVLVLIYLNPEIRPILLTLEYGLMIWIGLRHSIRAVTMFNFLVMLLILWESVQSVSFLSGLSIQARQFYVAVFVTSGVFASLLLFAMFEERRQLIQQLTEFANIDGLTQASNRRYFMECAERELTLAKRHNYPLSLVMLDLDHFKTINDRYGHETGDQALVLFVRCCNIVLRASDRVGRLGGEEFALLLPYTTADDAVRITQRLREVVRDQSLSTPQGGSVRLAFSAGVVESNPQATLDSMYRAADKALYDAKHAGRSRACIASLPDAANTAAEKTRAIDLSQNRTV